MRKELTWQTITELTENSAQDTNPTNNQTELTENSAQGTNVAKNQKGTQRIQCTIQ